jgi:hypothetical protein
MPDLECQLPCVILSEAKNHSPRESLGLSRNPRKYARDEILRFAQNDKGKRVRVPNAVYSPHDGTLRFTFCVLRFAWPPAQGERLCS